MNKVKQNKSLSDFKEYLKKQTATKEASEEFLRKLGVHTKNGNLSKKYV